MFSDASDMETIDDFWFAVKSNFITEGGEVVIEGMNASADGQDGGEGADDAVEKVIDLVHVFHLQEIGGFTKKDYKVWFKGYMKACKKRMAEANPDRVEAFMKAAAAQMDKENPNSPFSHWDDFEVYVGESYDMEAGMLCLSYYGNNGADSTPTFLYVKDGMIEEKC